MREIKFKVNIKDTSIVVDVKHISFIQDNIVVKIYDSAVDEEIWFDSDEVELLQYTGLKDKNGVEIYEGDIVKRTHFFNGGYGETHTGEVVYDKEYARYVISRPQKHIEPKTEDLRNTLSDKSTYEVIGNIWEDGDLLDSE